MNQTIGIQFTATGMDSVKNAVDKIKRYLKELDNTLSRSNISGLEKMGTSLGAAANSLGRIATPGMASGIERTAKAVFNLAAATELLVGAQAGLNASASAYGKAPTQRSGRGAGVGGGPVAQRNVRPRRGSSFASYTPDWVMHNGFLPPGGPTPNSALVPWRDPNRFSGRPGWSYQSPDSFSRYNSPWANYQALPPGQGWNWGRGGYTGTGWSTSRPNWNFGSPPPPPPPNRGWQPQLGLPPGSSNHPMGGRPNWNNQDNWWGRYNWGGNAGPQKLLGGWNSSKFSGKTYGMSWNPQDGSWGWSGAREPEAMGESGPSRWTRAKGFLKDFGSDALSATYTMAKFGVPGAIGYGIYRGAKYGIKDIAFGGAQKKYLKGRKMLGGAGLLQGDRAVGEAEAMALQSQFPFSSVEEIMELQAESSSHFPVKEVGWKNTMAIVKNALMLKQIGQTKTARLAVDLPVGMSQAKLESMPLEQKHKLLGPNSDWLAKDVAKNSAMLAKAHEIGPVWGQDEAEDFKHYITTMIARNIPLETGLAELIVGRRNVMRASSIGRAGKTLPFDLPKNIAKMMLLGAGRDKALGTAKPKEFNRQLNRIKFRIQQDTKGNPEAQWDLYNKARTNAVLKGYGDPEEAAGVSKNFVNYVYGVGRRRDSVKEVAAELHEAAEHPPNLKQKYGGEANSDLWVKGGQLATEAGKAAAQLSNLAGQTETVKTAFSAINGWLSGLTKQWGDMNVGGKTAAQLKEGIKYNEGGYGDVDNYNKARHAAVAAARNRGASTDEIYEIIQVSRKHPETLRESMYGYASSAMWFPQKVMSGLQYGALYGGYRIADGLSGMLPESIGNLIKPNGPPSYFGPAELEEQYKKNAIKDFDAGKQDYSQITQAGGTLKEAGRELQTAASYLMSVNPSVFAPNGMGRQGAKISVFNPRGN
jgi:hypothetical protein